MNRERYSAIAHATMGYCNPIGAATVARAIDVASPPSGGAAIDIGCGKGELLISLARTHGVRGTGLERSALMHEEAVARARASGVADLVHIRPGDAAIEIAGLEDGAFDLGACIGSAHALGGAAAALAALRRLVKPGGAVLWGEGYWKKPPSAEYLEKLGGAEDEMTTHAGNVHLAVSLGYVPLWAATASDREWDEYEWAYARNIERFARENPRDPDGPSMLERARAWRDLVLAHGRETMGFGLYVLER